MSVTLDVFHMAIGPYMTSVIKGSVCHEVIAVLSSEPVSILSYARTTDVGKYTTRTNQHSTRRGILLLSKLDCML